MAGIVEVAGFRFPTGLAAPAGKGGVQEGVDPVHGGLEAQRVPVRQIQLNDHIAALNQVQLLASNLVVAIGDGFFGEF